MGLSSIRPEIPRTFFHVLGGIAVAAAGYALPRPKNILLLGGILAMALAVDILRLKSPQIRRLAGPALEPFMRPSEAEKLSGAPAFVGGVFLAFLLYPRQAALLALIPLIFGDRAGLLVGKSIGRFRMWGKTAEGSAACFIVSFAVYLLLRAVRPDMVLYGTATLAAAALVGTVAEALPRPSDDNLVIPVAVGLFLVLAA